MRQVGGWVVGWAGEWVSGGTAGPDVSQEIWGRVLSVSPVGLFRPLANGGGLKADFLSK